MKKLILLLLLALTFTACKKNEPPVQQDPTLLDTYQPTTQNSTWNYQAYLLGIPNSQFVVTALGTDSVINNKTYDVFEDPSEADNFRFTRQDEDKYYTVLTAATNLTELLVLDISKSIGETWVAGVNGTDTYSCTVQDIKASYTLNNVEYKNVFLINQIRTNASNQETLNSLNYYAKGIGLIDADGTTNGIPLRTKITASDIK